MPTHLRYELRLEVTPRDMRVADEYLFLFTAGGNPPTAGAFPQGRSVSGTDLRQPDWQSVIQREGRSLTQFTPESTTQPTDLPQLRVSSANLRSALCRRIRRCSPLPYGSRRCCAAGSCSSTRTGRRCAARHRPALPKRLIASGQNLPWLALDLRNSDPGEFAAWIDHVRTALPQVKSIRVHEREEDHYAYFSVEYAGGYNVTSSGLSDGTLRILALTIIPFLPKDAAPRLLVTEEPENGIHPRAIETVVQSLSMLYDTQVWISTHSPIVLAGTRLRDVLATRLETDGSVTVVAGDQHPRLRDWKGDT